MDLATFTRLLDELPDVGRVTLQGLGEPLLAPDLFGMIAEATRCGVDVGFNTNGTLLTRERAERLVDAGLAWLHVSLDGATPETYESIRDRARFDAVRRNVQSLTEVMRERGATRPSVSLVFVAMRRNIEELPDVARLAGEWGVPELFVQNLSHSFSDTDPAGDYAEIRRFAADEALWAGDSRVREVFGEARRVAAGAGVALRLPKLEPEVTRAREPGTPGCDWPWQAAYVTHDGNVQPCCMVMGADRAVMGDVASTTMADIWHGDAYRQFRDALLGDEALGRLPRLFRVSRCVLTGEEPQVRGHEPVAFAAIDGPDDEVATDGDPTLVVAAHALSSSVRALRATLRTLRQQWERLDDDARDELFTIAEHHAGHLDGVLNDLLAGTPLAARRALESLEGGERED